MKQILLTMLLFYFSSFSQSNFHKGYFIDNKNTKIECLIKYENPLSTPSVFEYKLSEEAEPNYLNLQNSKLISIENIAKFVNATVAIDNHTSNIQNLERNKDITTSLKNCFLKVILEGKYTLYAYDENVERFFYSKDNKEIILLKYKQYYDYDSPSEISENTTFKRQLWNEVICESPKAQEINSLNYKLSDLEEYFTKINECISGQKQPIISKKYKGYFNVKASVYANFLNVQFTADEFQFSSKTSFTLTGQFEYVFSFNNFRWSVNIEPVYFKYADQSKYNNVNFFTGYNDLSVNTKINFFALPVGISYSFYKKENQQAYINLAQSIINSVNNNYYSIDNKPNVNFTLNNPSFSVGLGYNYQGFEMQYNFYPNFNNKDDYSFNLSRNAVIIRYTLFNNKSK